MIHANEVPRSRWLRLRKRVFEIVESGRERDKVRHYFDNFLISLIVLNVVAFAAETVPSLHARWRSEFYFFELFSVAIFTFEYIIRIWAGVEVPFLKRMSPFKARLRFASRPFLIIDLLAILPFYLSFLFPFLDLRVLRMFRILRFLKLARYSPALHTLYARDFFGEVAMIEQEPMNLRTAL